jgi:hypothetical protein
MPVTTGTGGTDGLCATVTGAELHAGEVGGAAAEATADGDGVGDCDG